MVNGDPIPQQFLTIAWAGRRFDWLNRVGKRKRKKIKTGPKYRPLNFFLIWLIFDTLNILVTFVAFFNVSQIHQYISLIFDTLNILAKALLGIDYWYNASKVKPICLGCPLCLQINDLLVLIYTVCKYSQIIVKKSKARSHGRIQIWLKASENR